MDQQAPNGQQPNNEQQPNYGYQQPNYGQQPPNYGYQQPNYSQQPPNYGYQQPNYGQQPPNYGYQPPRGVPPQVQVRELVTCIILSFVTCGIYMYYWLYTLNEDIRCINGDINGTSGGTVVLLSIVTCGIYMHIWMYQQGQNLDRIKQRYGFLPGDSAILYLLLSIFGLSIVSMALMQNELNKLPRY